MLSLRAADMANSERLSRISWLMAEIVQASEEKESLALAAWNSVSTDSASSTRFLNMRQVERHIRLLDQAIREQEIELNIPPTISAPALEKPLQEVENLIAPIIVSGHTRSLRSRNADS